MKKVISVLLAAMLLLSMLATTVMTASAEEKTMVLYEIPNELAANQMDGASEGWRNSKVDAQKAPLAVLELDGELGLGAAFSGAEPNYFNTIRFLYYTATPYDLTGIKFVEFDLYISDSSKYSVASNSIMIELCSSGRQDAYEISTDVRPELVDGWNHIRVNMEAFKPGSPGQVFDQTAWNFFRLCINGPYDTGSDELTVAIANLTFWNGLNEDGLDEEEIKQQEIMAKIKVVMDKINELKDIKSSANVSKENLESIKATIAQANELYDALDQESKDMVSEEGGIRTLKTAERAVKEYEEEQAEKAECTDHIDENADNKCDYCEADIPKQEPETPEEPENPENKPEEKPEETPDKTPEQTPTETPKEEGGCASSLTVGVVASMMLAGAWVAFVARKKND